MQEKNRRRKREKIYDYNKNHIFQITKCKMRFYIFDSILHYSIHVNHFKYYCLNIRCKFLDKAALDFLKLISNMSCKFYTIHNNMNSNTKINTCQNQNHYPFYHH